jgi:hypothetical protein
MKPFVALCCVVLAFTPGVVHAAGCEIGGTIGRSSLANADVVGVVPDIPRLTATIQAEENDRSFGFWLGCPVHRVLTVEATLPFLMNNHLATLYDLGAAVHTVESNAQIPIMAHTLVVPYNGRVAPFGLAGIGVLPNMDFDEFGLAKTIGAGIKIYLTRRLVVRVDVRRYWATLHDTLEIHFPQVSIGARYRQQLKYNEVSFGVGMASR